MSHHSLDRSAHGACKPRSARHPTAAVIDRDRTRNVTQVGRIREGGGVSTSEVRLPPSHDTHFRFAAYPPKPGDFGNGIVASSEATGLQTDAKFRSGRKVRTHLHPHAAIFPDRRAAIGRKSTPVSVFRVRPGASSRDRDARNPSPHGRTVLPSHPNTCRGTGTLPRRSRSHRTDSFGAMVTPRGDDPAEELIGLASRISTFAHEAQGERGHRACSSVRMAVNSHRS